jgi:hypothetical protein
LRFEVVKEGIDRVQRGVLRDKEVKKRYKER